MLKKVDYLPLGSVVIIRGMIKKTMIVARGLAANIDGETKVFDYGGCLYPEGIIGEDILYFNHADIGKLVFEGFSDDDNVLMVENINNWLTSIPYTRGNPLDINRLRYPNAQAGPVDAVAETTPVDTDAEGTPSGAAETVSPTTLIP
ncbi:MAG: DUF4176 domain-containing protein [Coriobacteriia bacterium]|nr:DUF4176 domain-containing protein [Coriobacteriia bacterium]